MTHTLVPKEPTERMSADGWTKYRRTAIAEMRAWNPGDDMSRVSVSAPDHEAGSPKPGDMIARNPKNHDDQWLVAAQYFADNFAPLESNTETEPDAWMPISAARKDGSSYLLKLRNDLQFIRPDLERWSGVQFVGQHPGLGPGGFDTGWRFAAPVGMGGFPDDWFVGWRPIGDAPEPDAVKALVEAADTVAQFNEEPSGLSDRERVAWLRAALRPFLKEGE